MKGLFFMATPANSTGRKKSVQSPKLIK